jgi:hypothetical protein
LISCARLSALQRFPAAGRFDMPLVQFSPLAEDAWTLEDAFQGTVIFGSTGSGKTSGSGQHGDALGRLHFLRLVETDETKPNIDDTKTCSCTARNRQARSATDS